MFRAEKKPVQSKESSLPVLTGTVCRPKYCRKKSRSRQRKQLADRYPEFLLGGCGSCQPIKRIWSVFRSEHESGSGRRKPPIWSAKFLSGRIPNARATAAGKTLGDLTKSIEELKGTIGNQEIELINFMSLSKLPLQDKGGALTAGILPELERYNGSGRLTTGAKIELVTTPPSALTRAAREPAFRI